MSTIKHPKWTETSIIGHRGCSGITPENTLTGISKASKLGVNAIEIDVVLLGDGTSVIYHDKTLKRCTSSKKELFKSSINQIKDLDVGSWFSSDFINERIPSLEEALKLIIQLGLWVNLELKVHNHSVRRLINSLSSVLVKSNKNNILISSFSIEALKQCSNTLPNIPRAYLYNKIPRSWLPIIRKLGISRIHSNYKHINKSIVSNIKDKGLSLYVYTVNTRLDAEQVKSWGVDGIFTDYPHLFLDLID